MAPLEAVEKFVRAGVDARVWVRAARARIKKVVTALGGVDTSEWTALLDRGPWELSYAEVVAAVSS